MVYCTASKTHASKPISNRLISIKLQSVAPTPGIGRIKSQALARLLLLNLEQKKRQQLTRSHRFYRSPAKFRRHRSQVPLDLPEMQYA